MRRPTPFIIPLFLPQWGCPHHCLYCSQETITGVRRTDLNGEEFDRLVAVGLASRRRRGNQPVEIAFYGANFTGLPSGQQRQLLAWGSDLIRRGLVDSLRLSTRPDALSEDQVLGLRAAGVRTLELGFQSLDDQVLEKTRRGHSVADNLNALALVKRCGLDAGVQLMPGLPGDRPEVFLESLGRLREVKPDFIRLYPTLVFKRTELAQWFREGAYQPPTLEEMLDLCCRAVSRLQEAGIPVIRLGLQNRADPDFLENLVTGPFHPAFGDLVRGRLFQERLCRDLKKQAIPPGADLELRAGESEVAYLKAHGGLQLKRLRSRLGIPRIQVKKTPGLKPGTWEARWSNARALSKEELCPINPVL